MNYTNLDTYDASATNASLFSIGALNFRGRRGRFSYFLVYFGVIMFEKIIANIINNVAHGFIPLFFYICLLSLTQTLLVANFIKRMHDLNMSTKYGFLFWVIAFIANVTIEMKCYYGIILMFPVAIMSLYLLIKKGDNSENIYGPVPK